MDGMMTAERVLWDPHLERPAKELYFILRQFPNITQKEVAEALAISKKYVQVLERQLRDAGYIVVEERHGRDVSRTCVFLNPEPRQLAS